jgi:hypothetical protein
MKRWRSPSALAVVVMCTVLGAGVAACDDDTREDVQDEVDDAVDSARERAEDAAGSVGARAAAEAMRASLQGRDLESDQTVRDVEVLENTAGDLPGDPTVSGIEDADGDGRDDDGKVQFTVGDQEACVTVDDNGEISVSGEAC